MSAINLTWDADGSIESFSVYRAEQSMDPNNLPTPIATGIKDRTYIDNDVVDDKTYFYRVASVKGGKQKISDEVLAVASPDYINHFYNLSGLTLINCDESAVSFQKKGGLIFTKTKTSAEIIKLEQSPSLQDFIAEFDYTQLSGTATWANLAFIFRSNYWAPSSNGSPSYALGVTSSVCVIVRGTDSISSSETWLTQFSNTIKLNQKYQIKIAAKGSQYTLWIDNVQVGSWNDSTNVKKGQFGFRIWDDTGTLSVLIENLVIKEN